MALSSRYAFDATTLTAGAFMTVAGFAFVGSALTWISVGIFIFLIVLGATAVDLDRHMSGYLTHGLIAAIAIWTLVATLVFAGSAQGWIIVAGAIATFVLGLVDLTVHEVTTDRVVHQLEVTPAPESATV